MVPFIPKDPKALHKLHTCSVPAVQLCWGAAQGGPDRFWENVPDEPKFFSADPERSLCGAAQLLPQGLQAGGDGHYPEQGTQGPAAGDTRSHHDFSVVLRKSQPQRNTRMVLFVLLSINN